MMQAKIIDLNIKVFPVFIVMIFSEQYYANHRDLLYSQYA